MINLKVDDWVIFKSKDNPDNWYKDYVFRVTAFEKFGIYAVNALVYPSSTNFFLFKDITDIIIVDPEVYYEYYRNG